MSAPAIKSLMKKETYALSLSDDRLAVLHHKLQMAVLLRKHQRRATNTTSNIHNNATLLHSTEIKPAGRVTDEEVRHALHRESEELQIALISGLLEPSPEGEGRAIGGVESGVLDGEGVTRGRIDERVGKVGGGFEDVVGAVGEEGTGAVGVDVFLGGTA